MYGPIAYMMSRFPHLPETFILREMTEMERLGWDIRLYPLMIQQQAIVHAEAERWIPQAQSSAFVSPSVIKANLQTGMSKPTGVASVWAQTVTESRRSPSELVRNLALIPKAITMGRWMKQAGIVHIHAHYATYPAFAAWVINRLIGIPYSVTVHAHDIYVSQTMLATKLRPAAAVIAISDYNREFLAKHAGEWIRAKTHVVHCGIRPDKYAPRSTMAAVSSRFEIISTGSLQEYKGHRYLIDACAILRDRGLAFRCRIIGGGEDRETLQQQIETLGLHSFVELMGPQSEHQVMALLPTADCYAQASVVTASGKMEGIPVALMEALACGLPVVATNISGIPELVRHQETGYLVPPTDPVALADMLMHIAEHREDAHRLGSQGRELVLTEFNLPNTIAQLSQVLVAANPALSLPASLKNHANALA